jgi:uncharacterized protein (DUF983 family)
VVIGEADPPGSGAPPPPRPAAPRASFATHLRRALRLRCPACGHSAIFLPLSRTRRPRDWFTPLDGCPRCGYAYEREPGYFLLSTWAINYSVACAVGLTCFALVDPRLGLPAVLAATLVPTVLTSLLLIRHSKALFIAIDVYADPPERRRRQE